MTTGGSLLMAIDIRYPWQHESPPDISFPSVLDLGEVAESPLTEESHPVGQGLQATGSPAAGSGEDYAAVLSSSAKLMVEEPGASIAHARI